jgi:hypothetical protein
MSACKGQRVGIDIDRYDSTLWANQVSDNARDLAYTTAHVEYAHALSDTRFVKGRACLFLIADALSYETLVFGFRSATIYVLLRL